MPGQGMGVCGNVDRDETHDVPMHVNSLYYAGLGRGLTECPQRTEHLLRAHRNPPLPCPPRLALPGGPSTRRPQRNRQQTHASHDGAARGAQTLVALVCEVVVLTSQAKGSHCGT